MLTSRDQYETMTIPYTIKIDGGIMPCRQNQDQLRGEDPAYLNEYMNRFIIIAGSRYYSPAVNKQLYGNSIRGQYFEYVVRWMKDSLGKENSYAAKPVYSTAQWDSMYVREGLWVVTPSPCDLNENAGLPLEICQSDENDFAHDQPLKKEHMTQLFSDLSNFKAVQTDYWQSNDLQNKSFNLQADDPNNYVGNNHSPRGSEVFSFRADDQWIKDDTFAWRWKRWHLVSGDEFLFKIPEKNLKYMASTALLFLEIHIVKSFWSKPNQGDWDRTYSTYYFPVTAKKTSQGYSVTFQQYNSSIEQVKQLHGLDAGSNPNPGGYSTDGSNGVYNCYITLAFTNWGVFKMNNAMDYEMN